MKQIFVLALFLAAILLISGCVSQTQTKTQYVCPDGSVVSSSDLCSPQQSKTVTKYVCPNGTVVDSKNLCSLSSDLETEHCYGKENMISQLQAENIAKHYALIQTKLVDPNITLQNIKLWGLGSGSPPRLVGNRKCNPNWYVHLAFNNTKNDEWYRYLIWVKGKIENESMQGIKNLPEIYVLKKVISSWLSTASYSRCPKRYVGGGGVHY